MARLNNHHDAAPLNRAPKALMVGAAVFGAVLAVEAGNKTIAHSNESTHVSYNENVLRNAHTIFDGSITLKSGVNLRTAPLVDNGSNGNGEKGNGTPVPSGKTVTLTRPLLVELNGGQWAVTEKPGSNPSSLRDKAADLVYVAYSQLDAGDYSVSGYDKDVTDSNIQPHTVEATPQVMGSNIEYVLPETGEPISHVAVATMNPDAHK